MFKGFDKSGIEKTEIITGTEKLTLDVVSEEELPSGPGDVPIYANKVENIPYCPITILPNQDGSVVYTAYITGPIAEVTEYIELIDILQIATPKDIVYIYIDSPGGYVYTGTAICSSIRRCSAKVITIARGMCASAGSLIWSAGHECRVEPLALLMYHMSSHMDFGNSVQIMRNAEDTVKYIRKCLTLEAIRKGHITQEELDTLTDKQQDIYINAEEMQKRLNANKSGKPINLDELDRRGA